MSGILRVKINGLNYGKILNELIENDVYLKNVKDRAKSVSFEIEEKNELKLNRICSKYKKRYEIISRNSFVNLIKKLRYYFGFLVAVILVVALIFSFNFSVYRVNIRVDSRDDFDVSNIEKILSDNGIVAGVAKNKINAKKLENLILKTQDNVVGVTVKQNGGIVDVVIYPGVLNQEVKTENIYSNFDAVIKDVQIFAGKSSLKSGDIVRKGDLLIKNDNGAEGIIMAKIYFSDFIIYNENQMERVKTGREITETSIMIFNKIFNKSKQNDKFSNYLEEKCVFSVSKNCFFPISIVKTSYKEFEYKNVVVKFEDVEEKLKEQLYNTVKEKAEGLNISNVTYSVVKENNLTRLDCFIECEVDLVSFN